MDHTMSGGTSCDYENANAKMEDFFWGPECNEFATLQLFKSSVISIFRFPGINSTHLLSTLS